jgi:hypothetical protein
MTMNLKQHLLIVLEEELIELSAAILDLNLFGGVQDQRCLDAVSTEWNDVLAVASRLPELGVAIRVDLNHSPMPYPRQLTESSGRLTVDISLGILDLAKTISKALRFGLNEQRDLLTSNKERIELGWLKIVSSVGGLSQLGVNLEPKKSLIKNKLEKLSSYTLYSQNLGVVVDQELYPTSEFHEDDGIALFVSFSRGEDGVVLGEPPEFYMGSGHLEDNFDDKKWTHFIKASSLNYIFESV